MICNLFALLFCINKTSLKKEEDQKMSFGESIWKLIRHRPKVIRSHQKIRRISWPKWFSNIQKVIRIWRCESVYFQPCVYIYIYMCMYVCLCMYVYVWIYMYVYVYVFVYVYLYICKYLYIYRYISLWNNVVQLSRPSNFCVKIAILVSWIGSQFVTIELQLL